MRFLVIFGLLLLASCAPDGEKSPTAKIGALRCFSITPPENHFKTAEEYPTCNSLCEKQGAVCSGVTSAWNPPQSCESEAFSPNWGICRCCGVGQ